MAESDALGGWSRHHILVIPFPAQGHMIPLLDLSGQLSAAGIDVTVVVTENVLHLLGPFLAGSPSVATLVLPLPAGEEENGAQVAQSLAALAPDILRWARIHPSPPGTIIHDSFNGWAASISGELAVPRIVFYASGAFAISVLDYLWKAMPPPDSGVVEIREVPGSPSFPYTHLPMIFRRWNGGAGAGEWEFMKRGQVENATAWAAVFNTFDALESPYLAHLRSAYGHDQVWAVGPLAAAATVAGEGRGGRSSVDVAEVRAWLDNQPSGSVVYVCFGSLVRQREAPARALAAALEKSGAGFVWCVRDNEGVLPEGFEGRVAGRGLVLRGWAPQVEILGHGSVGAFVTHCGWNSVLEGMVAGVALVAWPVQAEQFLNARMLRELGVAVMACEGGPDAVPDPDELGQVLRDSVSASEARAAAAAELGEKAKAAMRAPDGTSFRDFQLLISALNSVTQSQT